jgi:chorismate synthase
MLRFLTAGESHGPGLVTIVEGLPKGIPVGPDDFSSELARRRHGFGRSARMAVEADALEILGGIRAGHTLGSPVAVVIRNTEWPKWAEVMAIEGGGSPRRVTRPRPGHVDLAGMLKYDTDDARDVLERASARETAARTVAGVLAKKLLASAGAAVVSHVRAIGQVSSSGPLPSASDQATIDASEVRCLDPEASTRMVQAIEAAREAKDTLGGVFEVVAMGIPAGVGSHVHYDRRLDGLLAGAVVSIPAIKAVEIGDGHAAAGAFGSDTHDEIEPGEGGPGRTSNRAGGIEGGISNGEPIVVRGAMKPLPTLMSPLRTVDLDTGEPAMALRERADVCAVPAASVVAEQMVAFVLGSEMLRKFGGDTVGDFQAAVTAYRERLAGRFA